MAPRARAGVCVSAPRGKSAPQCPSPRAPGGRQHEQADAGARREAVPELVPHSPGQPPSHLRPPPTAWSRKCPAAATPCQDPPPPPHHHPPTRSNRSGRHGQRLPPPYKTSRRIRNPSKRATGSRNGGIYAGRMPGCGERGEGRPRSRSSASGGFWCDLKWAGRGWEEKVGEGAGNGIVGSCVVCLSERGRGSGVEWSGAAADPQWSGDERGGGVGAFGFPPPPSVRPARSTLVVATAACLLFARWSLAASPVLALALLFLGSCLFRLSPF